jgi:isopenicillin-N epimerase
MTASAEPSVLMPADVQGGVVWGRPLLGLWGLDPALRHLNHGAFGATPLAVLDEQQRWRRIMEANPARFFMKELPIHLRAAAEALASFVGTEPDRLGFVDNATTGCCTVLRELDLRPGDEILATDHIYNALRNGVRHVAGRFGAVLREEPLPIPLADEAEILDVLARAIGPRTRLVIVDHVASGSGATFPVHQVAALCRARGVPLLVDGAHAPGLVELDVDAIGADWYVGNCHKWIAAPKGAAFIAVSREPAIEVHPLAISHAYGQGFAAEFDKTGTRDATAWLSVPAAIHFHQALGGPALRARNRRLAREIAERIRNETGMETACAPALGQAMAAFRLPGPLPPSREASFAIGDRLREGHGIELGATAIAGALHLRFSVAAYNEPGDYEGLGAAMLDAARAVA